MRPPMQKTALQQNEANRVQQQQQQHSQLQPQQLATVHVIPPTNNKHLQQQQLHATTALATTAVAITTTTTAATATAITNTPLLPPLQPAVAAVVKPLANSNSNNISSESNTTLITATVAAARKSQKLEQHELLVENHLNKACFAQAQPPPPPSLLQSKLPAQTHLQHKIKDINAAHSLLQQQQQQQQQQQHLVEPLVDQQSGSVFYNDFYQHPQQQPRLIQLTDNIEDNLCSVKLLDLSTSPPGGGVGGPYRNTAAESREGFHQRQQSSSNSSSNSQRYSYASQYSRSSSSDESSSLSLSTACGSAGTAGGGGGALLSTGGGFTRTSLQEAERRRSSSSADYNTGNTACSSYSNTFDDAAENFIINFPADTTPTQPLPPTLIAGSRVGGGTFSNKSYIKDFHPSTNTTTTTTTPKPQQQQHQQTHNYCLPLSETEPLLTNIEATVKDRQRSIYLNKNSASLIFTKKDLSQTAATYQQQQQQYKLLSKTNNNFNGGSASTTSSSSCSSNTLSSVSSANNSSFNIPPGATAASAAAVRRSLAHSTQLRSFSEENYSSRSRKPTKHLPATYHQQHRRSLQLNYNNNLVTTTTCCSLANNNHHQQQQQHCCNTAITCAGGTKSINTNSAVLHKPHRNNQNHYYQQQQQQQQQQKQQHQQQQQQQLIKLQQQQQQSSGLTTSGAINNTATATRKQYAYSWYAPVYSALEEELEHDSRDSSPIHNLAATKKSNIQQYHRQHDLNLSSLTAAAKETDNEREALLETRNNINIHHNHQLSVGNHKRGGGAGGSVVGVGVGGGGGVSSGDPLVKQLNPSKLALQHSRNSSSVKGGLHTAKGNALNGNKAGGAAGIVGSGRDIAGVEGYANYDLEGPHAGSLGLAGGPQPRRIRFGNFLKSLVGLRPSVAQRSSSNSSDNVVPIPPVATTANAAAKSEAESQIPSSPEITITRTPSEQNMVVLRDPSGRQDYNVVYSSREKLANSRGERSVQTGSTSSLNVMQQKLWNIVRREGSAISLHQEKSQSIVHYTGLRKCETVIALTRQTTSPCSPTFSGCGGGNGNGGGGAEGCGGGVTGVATSKSQHRLSHTGSGIFSASGVEQIRPLNRLRNSVSSMNNTCSRCSSLLSLAASTSRFSLSNGTLANQQQHPQQQYQSQQGTYFTQNSYPQYQHQQHHNHHHQHQRYPSNVSSSNISSIYSHSRDGSLDAGLHFAVQRNSRTSFSASTLGGCQRNSNSTTASSRTPSLTSPTTATTATAASSIKQLTTPPSPTDHLSPPPPQSYTFIAHPPFSAVPLPLASRTTEEVRFLPLASAETTPASSSAHLTLSSLMKMPIVGMSKTTEEHSQKDEHTHRLRGGVDVIDGVSNNKSLPITGGVASANVTSSSTPAKTLMVTAVASAATTSTSSPESIIANILLGTEAITTSASAAAATTTLATNANHAMNAVLVARPFEQFTCKLCLIDVDDASNSTVLQQCGCQFCTECMKAYVEFEISEGAYEISCPDAQCPEQGAMTLPEIAMLTTTNLMKKHHRYRLNREIELDKTRTWCPRAGCETVCLIGGPATSTQSDTDPSASTSAAAAATSSTLSPSLVANGASGGGGGGGSGSADSTAANGNNITSTQLQCAVQCPSCKDEFCSSCKKTWHPNITCEEHGRRLAADGQDDIGIPFDNDLIKCCPMCAVPIEKDEGCAQMMCKRCKHVFCWYCLASLDDDFLLRHYDKGPCKNKLGHSRASVVWHRAQVIGIFAGFGILLLVASPLLLLAAPCIICCKCRSCSGSKVDEAEGDMDEATALQSLN